MITLLLLLAIVAPLAAALSTAAIGWCRLTACATVAAAAAVLGCGIALAALVGSTPHVEVSHLLRADGLSSIMLIAIGAVGTLSCWASIGYIDSELAHGATTDRRARIYGVLISVFLAVMTLAAVANNLGVMWVAIEATTVVTAFLVGHRGTRAALEATWKYVVICSVGIAFAFLGTVLLYFAGERSGLDSARALDFDVLVRHASGLDPAVTRMAAGLLLLGYGAKAGLAPMHTWLADAHSQAPAPVSALMSGVLLSVAFAALLRVKTIVDGGVGPHFMRNGLLAVGLLTLLIAASLLVGQRDVKRMLAYSSMENMGLLALAAAAGTTLAIAALMLHVLAHGIAKTVLFLCAGALQHTHDSTAIADLKAVLARSRLIGVSFSVGILALLGLPPFAMFASELSIGHGLVHAHLSWALGIALVLVAVSFAALVANTSRLLLGAPEPRSPAIVVPASITAALMVGVVLCLALGVAGGPLSGLLHAASSVLGAT